MQENRLMPTELGDSNLCLILTRGFKKRNLFQALSYMFKILNLVLDNYFAHSYLPIQLPTGVLLLISPSTTLLIELLAD